MWFGSDGRRTYTLEADDKLADDVQLKLTVVPDLHEIEVPFQLKDVKLP